MNDKRTVIGFLLIGLIFVLTPLYYEWMGISQQPEPVELENSSDEREYSVRRGYESENQREQVKKQKTQDVEFARSENKLAAAISVPRKEFEVETVTVETPLFLLKFSNKGGVLMSADLKKYKIKDGRPVELVSAGAKALSVSLLHSNGKVEDLSEAQFKPDRQQVIITDGQETLVMSATLEDGRYVAKEYTFFAEEYGFDCVVKYRGFDEDVDGQLQWTGGIPFTELDISYDLPEMGALASFGDNRERIEIKVDDKENASWNDEGSLQWIGVRSKYFLSAIIPENNKTERYSGVLSGDRTGRNPVPNYSYKLGRQLSRHGSWSNTVYLGPLDYDHLIRYDVGLEQAIDFGYPVIKSVSKFILIAFKATHSYIPNYGWIIVLFAVVIKIILYPLTKKSYESMAKMQQLAPKINALKEKYKNDQQKASQEMMKMYKEEGVNPAGGCLMMLPQMPIFFALYIVFSNTIELRQSPFALWITDLSLPDIVDVGGFPLRILPLLMALSMFVQQKMTMKDPKQMVFVYVMPVIMIVVFWSMASGLVLYWTLFNLLQIAQQKATGTGAAFGQSH